MRTKTKLYHSNGTVTAWDNAVRDIAEMEEAGWSVKLFQTTPDRVIIVFERPRPNYTVMREEDFKIGGTD